MVHQNPEFRDKVFMGIEYLQAEKSDSYLIVILHSLSHLICQLVLIDFTVIKKVKEGETESLYFYFRTLGEYLYFYRNAAFVEYDSELYISLGIILLLTCLYCSVVFLLYKHSSEDWQRYFVSITYHFLTFFCYPIFGFQIYYIKKASAAGQLYGILIALFLVIVSLGFHYTLEEVSFTVSLKTRRKYDRSYYFFETKKFIFVQFTVFYLTIRGDYTQLQVMIFVVLSGIMHMLDIIFRMRQIVYFNWYVNQFVLQQLNILVCFYFLSFIQIFVDLLRQNITVTVIISSFGFTWSQLTVAHNLEYELILMDYQLITSSYQAISYIRHIYHTMERYVDYFQSMLLAGLLFEHKQHCVDPECFCRFKKGEYKSPEYKDRNFLKKFGLAIVQNISFKFLNNENVILSIMSYKVEIVKQYPTIYPLVRKIKMEQNDTLFNYFWIAQEYMVFQIQGMVEETIQKDMVRKSIINIQEVFNEELLEKKMKINLIKMVDTFAGIYKFLNRATCNLDTLDNSFRILYNLLLTINNVWKKIKQTEIQALQIYCIFHYYFNHVLDHSFEEKYILERIVMITKKINSSHRKRQFSFSFMLFSDRGVVIESILNQDRMGIIHRVSRNAENFFGGSLAKILGSNIAIIFIPSHRQAHIDMVDAWPANAIDKIFNRTLEVYCLCLKQILFQAKMTIHIVLHEGQLKFQLAMVKMNEKDFIAVSSEGIIEGFGINFLQIIPQHFRGKKFSMICNKWEDIWMNATHSKQKIVACFQGYEMIDAEERRNSGGKENKKQNFIETDKFILELQYFIFQTAANKVVIMKSIQMTKQSAEVIPNIRSLERLGTIETNMGRIQSVKTEREEKDHSLSGYEKEDINNLQYIDSQSRSSVKDETVYSIEKILKIIIENAFKEDQIQSSSTECVRIILIILIFLSLLTIGGQIFFYSRGLNSYNQVVFANGAVNDNMQLLQFLYNKATNFYQYCGNENYNEERCQFISKSTSKIEVYLYSLLAENIEYFITNVTFFNNRYYEYEVNPVNFTINGGTIEVHTTQFMEFYTYATRRIIKIIQETHHTNTETDFLYKTLQDNWSQMKRLNHENLVWYKIVGDEELNLVEIVMIMLLVLNILIFTGFLLAIYWHDQKIEKKRRSILHLFVMIPLGCVQSLKNHYTLLEQDLKVHEIAELCMKQYPPIKFSKSSSKISDYSFNSNFKMKAILCFSWLIFVVLNILAFLTMIDLFPICEDILTTFNLVLDSQNYLLENYFELKVYYLQGSETPYAEFQKKLLQNLHQNQIDFTKNVLTSLETLYSGQDSTKNEEFTKLLIGDICEISKSQLTKWEVDKCQKHMHNKILQEGVMASMNYFQRIVYQAVYDLKKQSTNPEEYFKSKLFQDLDDYIIYMFKIYQKIQTHNNQGITLSINNRVQKILVFASIQGIILLVAISIWLFMVKRYRLRIAQLYGYLVMYPKIMLKQNKTAIKTIREVLFEDQ